MGLDFCSVGFGAGVFFEFGFFTRDEEADLEGCIERLPPPFDGADLPFVAILLSLVVLDVNHSNSLKSHSKSRPSRRKLSPVTEPRDVLLYELHCEDWFLSSSTVVAILLSA